MADGHDISFVKKNYCPECGGPATSGGFAHHTTCSKFPGMVAMDVTFVINPDPTKQEILKKIDELRAAVERML